MYATKTASCSGRSLYGTSTARLPLGRRSLVNGAPAALRSRIGRILVNDLAGVIFTGELQSSCKVANQVRLKHTVAGA